MPAEDDPFEHTRMSLGEHLEELRVRLVKGVGAVAVAFIVAWFLRDDVQRLVTRPYDRAMNMLEEHFVEQAERILEEDPSREREDLFYPGSDGKQRLIGWDRRLTAIQPGETFLFQVRICFYAAVVFGAPVLLWQMWQFVAAGLYAREKRRVRLYFPISLLAFAVGVSFGYFVIVPYGMYFLNKIGSIDVVVPNITMKYFLTFLTGLCLVFGAVFQLPLVMTFLGGAGVIEPGTMSRYRGHFVIGAFVAAAMLTPPDPFTQLMMALPLVVLYEVGIVSARMAIGRRKDG